MKASIIIPFVREYPLVTFTVMNIFEELRDRYDFEIIAVDNFTKNQVKTRAGIQENDKGADSIRAAAKSYPKNIRYLEYGKKLSHWQAKNYGVSQASGEILVFIDAHCVIQRDSLANALNFFAAHKTELNGSLHLPLTYKLTEHHKLVYKPAINREKAEAAYTFADFNNFVKQSDPLATLQGSYETDHGRDYAIAYEIACMSTCGMIMSRFQYDALGGWPEELGIYSGGEHFCNYASAILGYKKWIFAKGLLRHHGDERGYSFNFADMHRNRMIALYMFTDSNWLRLYANKAKPNPADQKLFNKIADEIEQNPSCVAHRNRIQKNKKWSFEEWVSRNIR